MKNKRKIPATRIMGYIIAGIIYTIAVILVVVCNWSKEVFGVGLEEILYTIASPLKGTESGVVEQGLRACVPQVLVFVLIYIGIVLLDCWNKVSVTIEVCLFPARKDKFDNSLEMGRASTSKIKKVDVIKCIRRITALGSIAALVFSLFHVDNAYQVVDYLKMRQSSTTLYEDYYVDPKAANIVADGDEKNLIYLYLESMEVTYASEAEGGNQSESYIPHLVELAEQEISFSDGEGIGGFHNTTGTGWTMAALLSTSSGVPYAFPVYKNEDVQNHETIATGLTTLGDILYEKGYYQEFLCGSDAEFGGRKTFFVQHGNYEIFDLFTAREEGYVPEDYYEWWGFEDKYLFEIAKDELLELSAKDEPFNFTLLTVDAHHVEGYVCELCQSTYETQTANVVSCTDRQVKEFIDWCKEQDFYEDTVIVVQGDHPRMDSCLVENVAYYDRTMYNCFINAAVSVEGETKNRIFTPMDMLPTIISAMGFDYDGNRLGLGTDMFSGEQTLAEELGYENLQAELNRYSKYYQDNFR